MRFIATSIAAAAMVSSSGVDALRLSTSTGALKGGSVEVVSSNFLQRDFTKIVRKICGLGGQCDSMEVKDGYLKFTCPECSAQFQLTKGSKDGSFTLTVLKENVRGPAFTIEPKEQVVRSILERLCGLASGGPTEGIVAGLVHPDNSHDDTGIDHDLVVKVDSQVAIFGTNGYGFTARVATFEAGDVDRVECLTDLRDMVTKANTVIDFCPANL